MGPKWKKVVLWWLGFVTDVLFVFILPFDFFQLVISVFSFANKSALIRAWWKTRLKGQKLGGRVEAKGTKEKIDFGFWPNWIRALKDIKFNMADRSWEALKFFHFITSFAYCFFIQPFFLFGFVYISFRNKRS